MAVTCVAEQDDVSPVVAMPMREGDVAQGADASTPSSDDELMSTIMPMQDDGTYEHVMSAPPATHRPIDPAFGGCGRTDLNASYQYGLINERMHRGRAINFTASSEYNLLAGLIPHHMAAVAMCDVYLNEVADVSANEGIESLCYNITYGPASRGKWQHDFSQVGETEQMLDVLREIGMMTQFERGCADLLDSRMTHRDGGDGYHGDMFMGCGRLDLPEAKDYMAANAKIRGFMALEWTGDNDVDFLLGLIPHHEGAMVMCDIYYNNWKCPSRRPCWDAHPLDGIPPDRLSYWKTHEVLADMKHICTDHIMATQPKEVAWMKAELQRLSPKSLAQYEAMTQNQTGVFPCSSV